MPDDRQRFVTDVQAAELLGLGVPTLRNWRCHGKGPNYVKFGRAVRYRVPDLLEWAEKNLVVPRHSYQGMKNDD